MTRRAVVWLVPVLFTAHNAEEAIAFRRYLPDVPALLPAPASALASRLTYAALLQTLAVVSVLAFALAYAVEARPRSRTLLWLLLALEATIGLNALSHLLIAVFLFRGYSPGLVSAVALNAPFAVYCFRRASRERWLSTAALRATLPAALVLHGPVLLAVMWLAAVLSR